MRNESWYAQRIIPERDKIDGQASIESSGEKTQAPEDVAQPDSRRTNHDLRKEKRWKSWIHMKTAKLLRVMSTKNELSKKTNSTQPSESIPETTVRSSAQQKFPWHGECEVDATENGHGRGARSYSQPPTLNGLVQEKTQNGEENADVCSQTWCDSRFMKF